MSEFTVTHIVHFPGQPWCGGRASASPHGPRTAVDRVRSWADSFVEHFRGWHCRQDVRGQSAVGRTLLEGRQRRVRLSPQRWILHPLVAGESNIRVKKFQF